MAIGGMVGLGSFIYTFTRLAAWLSNADFLNVAYAAAALLTPERILTDDRLDVTTGCAGTLLALLALYSEREAKAAKRERALDLALCCGRRLLAARAPYRSGPRAWPGPDRPPVSGFAHGAAGISYGLVRLFRATGESAFREAAMEGFAFERRLYDARENNWLDPRFNRFLEQSAWCHGAPGMALARLKSLHALDTPELREDIEGALSITRAIPEFYKDHLCCGISSRIEILRIAGEMLNRPELLHDAERESARLLARAAEDNLDFGEHATNDPSLFLGFAGVGYTLLRAGRPGRFPCVLALE